MSRRDLILAKMAVRERLETHPLRGGDQSIRGCEGKRYLPDHICIRPIDVNEVLVPKWIIQKKSIKQQVFFYHEFNCALNCRWFHEKHGHSKAYMRHHLDYIKQVYGEEVIEDWILRSPLKIKVLR